MSSSPLPQQLAVAHAFMEHLNALEWDQLAALIHQDFQQKYRPRSIVPVDGKETRDKDTWIGILKFNLTELFEYIKWTIHEETHGVDRVVFHMTSEGRTKSGEDYDNEYMITFKFSPGSEQIIWLDEFVDSKYSSAFFGALRAEMAAEAAREADKGNSDSVSSRI